MSNTVHLIDPRRTAALLHAYERGELDQDQTVELFAELIRSGVINTLQGSYQRTTYRLICRGLITPELTAPDTVNTTITKEPTR